MASGEDFSPLPLLGVALLLLGVALARVGILLLPPLPLGRLLLAPPLEGERARLLNLALPRLLVRLGRAADEALAHGEGAVGAAHGRAGGVAHEAAALLDRDHAGGVVPALEARLELERRAAGDRGERCRPAL